MGLKKTKTSDGMKHTFTRNDLVAYVYGDATPAQAKATEAALAADPVLRHELAQLVAAQASLPRVRFSPRRRLVDAIRRYASSKASPRLCY